jgi:hypothetical protein
MLFLRFRQKTFSRRAKRQSLFRKQKKGVSIS